MLITYIKDPEIIILSLTSVCFNNFYSEAMAFIPNNVYTLYNETSGTVLDLSDGT